MLRLTGSTTVGAVLAPRLATAYLRSLGASRIETAEEKEKHVTTISGTTRDGRLDIVISTPGSGGAFEALQHGDCDIGMASRPILEEEAARLSSLGDMTGAEAEHVIALDGVAIVVNRQSTVGELTLVQAADLFTGKVHNWSAVGGSASDVHVFSRDAKSGTSEVVTAALLQNNKILSTARIFTEGGELADAVAKDRDAIGFVSVSQTGSARAVSLRDGNAPAIAPSAFTIATEDYPLARRLFLYVPPKAAHPHVSEFISFALSEAGQEIVDETGFVSLKVRSEARLPEKGGPAPYVQAIRSAQRLAVDFRFETASAKLDAKGRADLDRVASFAKSQGSRQLLLFGFTDDQGDSGRNESLSRDRAKGIESELSSRGAHVLSVDGFGSAMPVATNESEPGRRRNRRVEVWMR